MATRIENGIELQENEILCDRCWGNGKYFHNGKNDRCYKCGGNKKFFKTPDNQKKFKVTCKDYEQGKVGDVVKIEGNIYLIEDIRWAEIKEYTNQIMFLKRLADNKNVKIRRAYKGYDPDCGFWNIFPEQGVRKTSYGLIDRKALIGFRFVEGQYDESFIITENLEA